MFFKRAFLHSPVRYIVAFIIVIGIAILYIALQNNGWVHLVCYHYGLMTGGVVCFLFGGLVFVEYYNVFNMLGYGLAKIFGNKEGYIDLIDYNERKEQKKKMKNILPYFPYLVVGLIGFLIGLFLGIFQ